MKILAFIIVLTSVVLLGGCSKKDKTTKEQPGGRKVAENPQTRYGKSVKKTEDLVKKVGKDQAENAATMTE